ncbi:MAG TPA: hypothetical protein VIA06_08415 [Candidatus Dormibacteraeota bacterium]|nr:hypothetical protein [Candidatus Dormibacteraeota bacterium]
MNVPPLVFYAEILVLLALGALVAATLLYDPSYRRGQGGAQLRRFVAMQRDLAATLGMSLRTWLVIRIAITVVGLALGALTSVWTVIILGGLLGWVAVPWLLEGRAAKRRLSMERAVTALVREIASLMQQSNLTLDRALREAARNPAPELASVLAPLRSDRAVPECLAEVSTRARSSLADVFCIGALVARTHDPAAFVQVSEQVLTPVLNVAVEIQEENHATLAQQRTASMAIGVVMAVLFFALMRVSTMRHFYAGVAGQLVLLVVIVIYLGLVWVIGQVARPVRWTEWDVDAVRREMEVLLA